MDCTYPVKYTHASQPKYGGASPYMYKLIENPRLMSQEEIDNAYNGSWVYIVKANIDPHGKLIAGVPVVLGEFQFAGVDEGIYKQFDGSEFGRKLSYTLLPHDNTISSVFGMAWN
jgi:hypothetical protein